MPRYSFEGDNKKSPFRFLRIFLDVGVIVFSIYLAFVVDNWRDGRKETEKELKYVAQLLEEAKINQDELKADQDARKDQIEYLKKLVDTPNRQVAPDSLRVAIKMLVMVRIYSPTDAVYQDLVSSGNLGVIKSESVKRILLNYRRSLARVPITEQNDVKSIQDHIEPYLIRKKVLSLLEAHGDLEEIEISDNQIDRIIRILLSDREFIDLVYLRIHKLNDVIFFENPMQWQLRMLISELEKELNATS